MPKARTPNRPQHHAGDSHYGAFDVEHMPNGAVPGDMFYWDGVQWNLIRLIGGGGMDISFDAVNKTLEIYYADNRVYGSYLSDAILFRTYDNTITADAELVV